MGTKTTTKKATVTKRAAAKPAAAKTELTDGAAAPKTVTKPRAVRATKPAAPKKPRSPRASKTPAPIAAFFTAGDIAMRAYFIGEERQRSGLPGTPEGDWLEAERQLRAEAVA